MKLPDDIRRNIDKLTNFLMDPLNPFGIEADHRSEALKRVQRARAVLSVVENDEFQNFDSAEVRNVDPTGEGVMTLSQVMGTPHPAATIDEGDSIEEKYENYDPGWLSTVTHVLFDRKVAFPQNPQVLAIPDQISFSIVGDWGTGEQTSFDIIEHMVAGEPDYTIHLGDVYYAGTPEEEQKRFVTPWKVGKRGSFTLNSNHEMYCGGKGYFDVALRDAKFAQQAGTSYFALYNEHWLIIGLDTAYEATGFMYLDGHLNQVQLDFIAKVMAEHSVSAAGTSRKLILLSHHEPMDLAGKRNKLWGHVTTALVGRVPDYWYWGHLHAAGVLKPQQEGRFIFRGRCVGHGGVSYSPEKMTSALEWTETQTGVDLKNKKRAMNGFVNVVLDGPLLTEEFRGEDGSLRWS